MTNLAREIFYNETITSELNYIDEQDKKIDLSNNTTDKNDHYSWSEYIINIITSYFGFLLTKPKFFYKNNNNDDIKEISPEDDNDFFDKINKVRANQINV